MKKYMVAYYNEYMRGGIHILTPLDYRQVIKLVRKYYEFPEEITTVKELADYYINGGQLEELDGDTMITVQTIDNVVLLNIY